MKTTKKQILEYHYKNTSEIGMGCDKDEWHKRCWRCGYERDLERCHIVPNSLNGKDEPSNYVLLCNMCHQEAPNVNDSKYMFKWIEETSISSYDCYWNYREIIDNTFKKVSVHFGHKGKVNMSTFNWVLEQLSGQLPNTTYIFKIINSSLGVISWDEYVSKQERYNFEKTRELINKHKNKTNINYDNNTHIRL